MRSKTKGNGDCQVYIFVYRSTNNELVIEIRADRPNTSSQVAAQLWQPRIPLRKRLYYRPTVRTLEQQFLSQENESNSKQYYKTTMDFKEHHK